MPAGLASAALKEEGYDLIRTVDEALNFGFEAVQLFIDSEKFTHEYYLNLISRLKETDLKIVIHLREYSRFTQEDLDTCELLSTELVGYDLRFLIHYSDGMTPEMVPQIKGRYVGIENSKTGTFDMHHVKDAFAFSREIGAPFVFDHCRIMYPAYEDQKTEIISAIINFIRRKLDPNRDIIHTADKSDWSKRFRECWAALGSPDAIGIELLPTLIEYSEKGGIVMFEHEDFDSAINSLSPFKE